MYIAFSVELRVTVGEGWRRGEVPSAVVSEVKAVNCAGGPEA